jgi:dienelactone hydrolase
VVYDGAGRVGGLFVLPPEVPWQPPSYASQDAVERPVPVGRFKLPGRFLRPKGAGPFPAVVLVHGSGPSDEDELVGAVRVFRDLAYGLAAHGIASIRYPKRPRVYPGEFAEQKVYTVKEEVTEDVRAALAALARQREVNPKRLWLVAHSLGAMLAPRIAREDQLVAGMVLLAGPVRPIEDHLLEQIGARAPRGSPELQKAQAFVASVRDTKLRPTDVVDFGGVKIPGSYFLDLRSYRPADTAAALNIPIFVVQGGRDMQTPPAELDLWKKRLPAGEKVKLKLYPALNHLLVAGSGIPTAAEYSLPGHVAEEVIVDIQQFILSAPRAP